jgi:predicted AAA+ superfamily ATPase
LAPNQVQSYLQFIANAFIIHKVNRYDIIGKRIFEIGEKYYFENLGLRHSIWGYRLEDRAKILENAVYNHLLFKGYKVYVGKINQLEIDFIAEKDNEIAYYQVALTINDIKTLNREIKSLEEIPDNYPKTLITYEAFKGKSIRGIKNIDLSTFLLS